MREAWHHLSQYLRFQALPADQRRLVVYSEGPASWPHLGPVVQALLQKPGVRVTYVSSRGDDPGLHHVHPQLTSLVIGDGHMRTLFFAALKADLVLMTMPDLQTFHIKRSAGVRCYAYLHHSVVSHHMVYRSGAFDHFDAVLCVGPHHEAELRALEKQRGSPPKALLRHGYGRLDEVAADAQREPLPPEAQPVVLLAPSWGPCGLLERHAETLMRGLADSDWHVIVRPHPQTVRLAPQAIRCVEQWCARVGNLQLETGVAGHRSLLKAQVMVSDWSGAAFDFALGCERPVLFVDVPRKVNNPGYQDLRIEPIEVFAREHIGRVVVEEDLACLPEVLREMQASQAAHREAIRAFRERWVYNNGCSAEAGAEGLLSLLAW